MVHDDDTGQRPWNRIEERDRPLPPYLPVDPEIGRAIRYLIENEPNFSRLPLAIHDELLEDFPDLTEYEIRVTMRALSGPGEPSMP